MLNQAYDEELISRDNPLDETPEIMHYLIWHHDGRRWRMGASMMAPDWTHWNGAVDAIMNKLGTMINDIESRRRLKAIEDKLELLSGPAGKSLRQESTLTSYQGQPESAVPLFCRQATGPLRLVLA